MIWFGSSAGVALSNMYPGAKNAGSYLRHGWHVAIAYVVGFFILLLSLGWNPDFIESEGGGETGDVGVEAPARPHVGQGAALSLPHP